MYSFVYSNRSNDMATTYKTKQSKFWFARYTLNGKRISKSTKSESRREAKRIAAGFEAQDRREAARAEDTEIPAMIARTVELAALELQQGRLTLIRAEELIRQMVQAASPEDTGGNFKRFAGEWLDIKEKATAGPTWRSYRDAVKAATAILGAKAEGPMRHITVADMERVQAAMAETLRGRTVNYYFSVVRRILQSAVEKDILTKNPAQGVKGKGTGDSRRRAEFDADEVRAILSHVPSPEWYGLVLLGAQTGLRMGDLLKLTADSVVGNRLQIQPSKGKVKSGDVLKIPLRPEGLAWLAGREGELFPTIKRMKSETASGSFIRFMRDAGVANRVVLAAGDPPVIASRSFHSLRHTFTSWMANADVASDVRQKLTGHKSESVHRRYTHHDAALDRAIEALPSLEG